MMLLPILMAVHSGEDDTSLVAHARATPVPWPSFTTLRRLTFSLIVRVVRDAALPKTWCRRLSACLNRVHGFDVVRGSIGPWLLAVAQSSDRLPAIGGRTRTQCRGMRRNIPRFTATWKKTF
jgi:hypothetical protein